MVWRAWPTECGHARQIRDSASRTNQKTRKTERSVHLANWLTKENISQVTSSAMQNNTVEVKFIAREFATLLFKFGVSTAEEMGTAMGRFNMFHY